MIQLSSNIKDSKVKSSSESDVSINTHEDDKPHKKTFTDRWHDVRDSFKRYDPTANVDTSNMTSLEIANIKASKAPLKRKLKARHVTMISLGSAIGTGLFVGSGKAVESGGPASVIICYFLVGVMIFFTVQALGELAVAYPVAGSFLPLISRFLSPAWGFVIAWNYAMQWLTLLPLELVASSLTIQYWNDSINSAVWVAIFYVAIVVVNICGVRGYGEVEFVLSFIKVIAIIGFSILGVVIDCGGGPKGSYIGGKYFHHPGAFHNGFKGLCSVFVTAAFSFGGTELVGLAAAETDNPTKTLPAATKQVFWRIVLFYLISLTIVGLLVPYDDERLLGSGSTNIQASPFVIAIQNAGIKVLPSIFNAVVLISVLSVANSAVFGCSRTVSSLALQGFAPECFGYIDRKGRPIVGIAISLAVGLLCFLASSPQEATAFTWLMAISGLSSICTWGSICFAHVRFREAMKLQKRTTAELKFNAAAGTWGSWFGGILNVLVLVVEFWIAVWPLGDKPNAAAFFENYLNIVVNVVLLAIYIVWKRKNAILWVKAEDLDLDTGRKDFDPEIIQREKKEEAEWLKKQPFYYRFYKIWC